MKTYLVTGGAGFIGSNFVLYMLKKHKDIRIINVDKLTYAGNLENLKSVEQRPALPLCAGGYLRRQSDPSGLFERYDDRLRGQLCRGKPCGPQHHRTRRSFVKTNVKGTVNLLNSRAKNAWAEGDGFKAGVEISCRFLPTRYTALWARRATLPRPRRCDPHSPYSAQPRRLRTFSCRRSTIPTACR